MTYQLVRSMCLAPPRLAGRQPQDMDLTRKPDHANLVTVSRTATQYLRTRRTTKTGLAPQLKAVGVTWLCASASLDGSLLVGLDAWPAFYEVGRTFNVHCFP